ncbi:MAG: hypothetical protein K0S56_4394 [Microvirga sp.]|jgi:hypothetical protein|nr:hypothetical protein [Microvirga sp.]
MSFPLDANAARTAPEREPRAISRRALFAGALIPIPLKSAGSAQDTIHHCAWQLLSDAREARLNVTYDATTDRFVFADLPDCERTESESDTAFFVKWGLKARPRLREAVIILLTRAAKA